MIGEWELRYALMEAKAVALHTSRCRRKKVGAVLFDREGKFVAYGANINPPKQPCDEGFCPRGQKSYGEVPADAPYGDCTAWHAEMVALLLARERMGGGPPQDAVHSVTQIDVLVQLEGGVMVVTHEPCHECMPRLRGLNLNVYWPGGRMIR